MTKIVFGLAVAVVCAGNARAQSDVPHANVLVYGELDVGLHKLPGVPLAVDRSDNNRLGLRGSEALGDGLAAIFALEIRFDPDLGTTESRGRRPLFQGRSFAGLAGWFGKIRVGRDWTAVQEAISKYDPLPYQSVSSMDALLGNYSSDPSYAGSSGNRFANALFYRSPAFNGLQANLTLASKEGNITGVAQAGLKANPYSLALTYHQEGRTVMLGAERNTAGDLFRNIGASYKLGRCNLSTSYSRFKPLGGSVERNWLLGADIAFASAMVDIAYGQIKPEQGGADRQLSVSYGYHLSKRVLLYAAVSQREFAVAQARRTWEMGLRQVF